MHATAGARGRSAIRIAIDGPSAAGKSAVGSRVAARLGIPFVDTGTMYRALTWLALERGIDPYDGAALTRLAESTAIEVGAALPDSREACSIRVDGADVTAHIREARVEQAVSPVSAVPGVRTVMVRLQRQAAPAAVVMAGRDIGTVVLPDADLKVYIEASEDVRARRRRAELLAKGRTDSLDEVRAALRRRDRLDSERALSPLKPAADAVILQTDALTLEAVVERVVGLVAERDAAIGEGLTAEGRALTPGPSPESGRGVYSRGGAGRLRRGPASSDHAPARSPESPPLPDSGEGPGVRARPSRNPIPRPRATLSPGADFAGRAFYRAMTGLMRAVVWTFGRYEIVGAEKMPRTGPLIVVANHLNNADPPLLGASLPRPIRFMAKQELFDSRFGLAVRLFGAFPVRRFEADLAALRQAQTLLRAGEVIGMFPEGHRSRTGGIGAPNPGTALIALRADAPILPVAITGTEAIRTPLVLLRKPRIRVVVGEPFRLPASRRPSAAEVHAGTEAIMRRIAALLPEAYRGVYGGEAVGGGRWAVGARGLRARQQAPTAHRPLPTGPKEH